MRKSFILILLSLGINLSFAQGYKMHSVWIYGFTRHVIWPEQYRQGDFEILVLGDSPILGELKNLAQAKKVDGTRTIKVSRINSVSEIRKCNILFVPAANSSQLADVLAKINSQPTLILTEEPGLSAKGSHINFIDKGDGKVAFELNQAAVTKHNLKVSNTLASMRF